MQITGNKAFLRASTRTVADTARNFREWASQANVQYKLLLQRKAEQERQREIERNRHAVVKAEEEAQAVEALRWLCCK